MPNLSRERSSNKCDAHDDRTNERADSVSQVVSDLTGQRSRHIHANDVQCANP